VSLALGICKARHLGMEQVVIERGAQGEDVQGMKDAVRCRPPSRQGLPWLVQFALPAAAKADRPAAKEIDQVLAAGLVRRLRQFRRGDGKPLWRGCGSRRGLRASGEQGREAGLTSAAYLVDSCEGVDL
jgi:hypothetical protein